MYAFIDLVLEIIPLVFLIGIPILRGLNNSNKQKKEYQEKRRRVDYNPPTRQESNVSSWKTIIREIEKELNKSKQKNKDKKKKNPSMNIENSDESKSFVS